MILSDVIAVWKKGSSIAGLEVKEFEEVPVSVRVQSAVYSEYMDKLAGWLVVAGLGQSHLLKNWSVWFALYLPAGPHSSCWSFYIQ